MIIILYCAIDCCDTTPKTPVLQTSSCQAVDTTPCNAPPSHGSTMRKYLAVFGLGCHEVIILHCTHCTSKPLQPNALICLSDQSPAPYSGIFVFDCGTLCGLLVNISK